MPGGPPQFAKLTRTKVQIAKPIPTQAELAQDLGKVVPVVLGAPEQARAELSADQQVAVLAKPTYTGPKLTVVRKAKEPVVEAPRDASFVIDEEKLEGLDVETRGLILQVTEAIKGPQNPPVIVPTEPFVPENRKAFIPFIIESFSKYKLPPVTNDPDPNACNMASLTSSKDLKSFAYQSFVRDYLQRASPYRGLLVYHGLGSGKTCTSIATAEALYGAGTRKIYVMTPASLRGNYRGELQKCGFFAFNNENYWTFLPAKWNEASVETSFLQDTLGIPIELIRKQKGAWVPDPTLPSNWASLSPLEKDQISKQIQKHIDARFTFINYNGLSEKKMREYACNHGRMFDGAVVIIDEVHNLIRTINNSKLEANYNQEPVEAEYVPRFCKSGRHYPITYLLYRMLCNSVGCKIVALSGTPIINYPQELGILANLLSGDMRYMTANLTAGIDMKVLQKFLETNPEVDLFDMTTVRSKTTIRISPVPSGYVKVVDPATGAMRGFVRDENEAATEEEINRERNLEEWQNRIEAELQKALKTTKKIFNNANFGAYQRLPDYEKPFVDTFIDKENLTLKKPEDIVLMGRLSGLISFYKAGKPELVAKVTRDELVMVDMSDYQLDYYTGVRTVEIKQEERDRKAKQKTQPKVGVGRYNEVMKSQKGTFKIFSRAACNFVFPERITRPKPGDEKRALEVDLGRVRTPGSEGGDDDDVIAEADIDATEVEAVVEVVAKKSDPYLEAIQTALINFRKLGAEVFSEEGLKMYSPKYQSMLNNMETSRGPILVYSQFKTLEGLGLFSLALEFQKNYIRFNIEPQANGHWALSPELMLPENLDKKRYIMYTGDEPAEKRDMLKHIFNANWRKMPAELSAAVKTLAKGAQDNRDGLIAQVFMITQSGAEGISLENVRQVHLMEPYWNYVRLEQVRGRAIRICSHKSLDPAERNVEVFTYISKFSDAQKSSRRVNETLVNKDKAISTDESIFSVAKDKKKLAESLFGAMREAAVDCVNNATENGQVTCYRLENRVDMSPLYEPNLDKDVAVSAASMGRKVTVGKV